MPSADAAGPVESLLRIAKDWLGSRVSGFQVFDEWPLPIVFLRKGSIT